MKSNGLDNGIAFQIDVEPWPEQFQSWVDDALSIVPVHNVNFYVHKYDDNWPPLFAGNAGFDDYSTYSITVSSYWIESYPIKFEPYMKWVLRHELRHCKPENLKGFMISPNCSLRFRPHDITLYDIDREDRTAIGFFWEDFDEIKCCDFLMKLFRNVEGIEEYLK